MTDIQICEETITSLTDKLNAATKRVEQIVIERRQIGFAFYAEGDKSARAALDKLNAESSALAYELEGIKGALTEAHRRLDAARQVTEHVIAQERRARARVILEQLEALVPELDFVAPHPDGIGT
jgi:Tfp pilus assembly protein PilN